MDQAHFAAAEAAYEAADYDRAAREYLASVDDSATEGSGRAYHQAGNALMRLKRYSDAATVYRKALDDPEYGNRAFVGANLGTALSAAGKPEDALAAFEGALQDETYPTPYKALQGRAGALYDLERYDEAATAYREAAWADGNPDPGRALNNLGLTFMALGKPQDAVEAFKAAIGISGYASTGKATANLAQAYAEMGFFEEAVREFENARDVHGYALTGDMLGAYEKAVSGARREDGEAQAESTEASEPPEPLEVETIEGWVTGEIRPVAPAAAEGTDESEAAEDTDLRETRFFTMSEDDMRVEGREAKKAERKAARTPAWIAVRALVVIAIVALLAGGIGAGIYYGYGFPTQEQTVSSMLDAYHAGKPVADFWVAVPQTDVTQDMRQLPARFASFSIAGVDRAALKSTARVVVKLDTGSVLDYDVLLVREGVGWKVDGIRNTWDSTGN